MKKQKISRSHRPDRFESVIRMKVSKCDVLREVWMCVYHSCPECYVKVINGITWNVSEVEKGEVD